MTLRDFALEPMTMRELALERLRGLHARPQMFAYTREAFVMQVLLLLELLDEHAGSTAITVRVLHEKEFKVPNTCAADRDKLIAPVDDDWARAFIRDALQLASLQLHREFHHEKPEKSK